MTPLEQSGFELLEQALKAGVPTSFRVSIPAQVASIVSAPVFTWMIWKGSGLHLPVSWIFLGTLWVFWYLHQLSPHKITIDGSLVSVHWWYRRIRVGRSTVLLTSSPTTASRLFGHDFLVVGEVGKFPVWPAYFLVTKHEVEAGTSQRV